MKKIIVIITILLLTSCKASNKPSVSEEFLNTKTNEFEYGSLVKLSNLFEDKELKFTQEYLDTSFIGEKTSYIEFEKNNQLFKEEYTYSVVDTTEPLIWIAGSYTITKGSEDNLTKKIICADNHAKKPNCYIEGDYDVNKVGSYKLKFIAEDEYGNKESANFTLYVTNPKNSNGSTNSNTNKIRTDIKDVIKKYKNEDIMIGIDVSKYQGDINWKKVKDAGVEFAMIRMGTQWYFGEEYIIDPYFEKNAEGALANDIKVGIYFYSYARNAEEGKEQAQYVIDNIKKYDITFPVAYDWESYSTWNDLGISLFDLQSAANAFQDEVRKAGYTPIHYGSKNYLNAFWQPIKYDTWLAHYTKGTSDYDKDYKMWQLCNNGLVDGISGDVDIDVYYK